MRKEIKGAGMTAQEWEHPETPEEKKQAKLAAAEAWRAGGSGFEVVVVPYEKWALGQLAAFGFKDVAAFREKNPIIGDSLGDRALHYAVQVLCYIQIVRKAITDNNAQEAARFAISIGELFNEIQMTLEWEKFALHGKHSPSKGGKKTAGDRKREAAARDAKLKAAAKKIRESYSTLVRISDLARMLSTRGYGNVDVIRKKLSHLLSD